MWLCRRRQRRQGGPSDPWGRWPRPHLWRRRMPPGSRTRSPSKRPLDVPHVGDRPPTRSSTCSSGRREESPPSWPLQPQSWRRAGRNRIRRATRLRSRQWRLPTLRRSAKASWREPGRVRTVGGSASPLQQRPMFDQSFDLGPPAGCSRVTEPNVLNDAEHCLTSP